MLCLHSSSPQIEINISWNGHTSQWQAMLWDNTHLGQYWQRLTEDTSCRAAAWGPQWAHSADTESARLATTTWRQLLVRGQYKEPRFCLLCSRSLPVRGWAPKENTSGGWPDVCICAPVSWNVYDPEKVRKCRQKRQRIVWKGSLFF